MFIFNLKRSTKDIIGHLILIVVPVILIAFFNFIYSNSAVYSGIHGQNLSFITLLTIGFTLTFQIYGASLSFETIGADFFSPMRDRLAASPADLRRLILAILLSATVVSSLQTIAVLVFSTVILQAPLPSAPLILATMILSIVFHQLLGSTIMLASRSVKTSNAILSTYGAIAPMLIGLYFPLPDTRLFSIIKNYSTPIALANTAIKGIISNDIHLIITGMIPLTLLTIILFFVIRPLIGRISA